MSLARSGPSPAGASCCNVDDEMKVIGVPSATDGFKTASFDLSDLSALGGALLEDGKELGLCTGHRTDRFTDAASE
jgi:hypothetical protein